LQRTCGLAKPAHAHASRPAKLAQASKPTKAISTAVMPSASLRAVVGACVMAYTAAVAPLVPPVRQQRPAMRLPATVSGLRGAGTGDAPSSTRRRGTEQVAVSDGRQCLGNRAGAPHIEPQTWWLAMVAMPAVSTNGSSWGWPLAKIRGGIVSNPIQFLTNTYCWRQAVPSTPVTPDSGEKTAKECEILLCITPR